MKNTIKRTICILVIATISLVTTLSVNAGYLVASNQVKSFNTGYGSATAQLLCYSYPEWGNDKNLYVDTTVSTNVPRVVCTGTVVDYYSGARIASSSGEASPNYSGLCYPVSFNKSNCTITGFGAHEVRGYSAWGVNTAIYGVYMA